MLLLLYNIGHSLKNGLRVGANPWDAPTLEWATTSPPPVYNFAEQPMVASRDPLWAEKYGHHDDTPAHIESEEIVLGPNAGDDVHLPNSSFWPFVSAMGMLLFGLGFLFDNITVLWLGPLAVTGVSIIGMLLLVWGIFAWAFEPTGVEGLH
jgi:heme/copper-type cytochrome/quinol oxidase subunit 1